MRVRHAAPAVGLICLAVAGCTTTSRGEPAPGTTSVTAPSSGAEDLPSHGAPKVDNPLDTARFQQDPCSTLTASQAEGELNLPPNGEPEEIALGKGCEWFNPDTRGQVNIGFLTRNHSGLSGFYDANQRGEYPYFIELPPIESYPAIASDIEDRRPMGECIVVVGTSDQLAIQISLQLSQANVNKTEPCELAAKVAGMALRTMKEA